MNREIKFRGLALYGGQWVYGYLVGAGLYYDYKYILPIEKPQNTGFPSPIIHNDSTSISGFVEVNPKTVGQFTGRHDKNGKEIYGAVGERGGDIIYEPRNNCNAEVVFEGGDFGCLWLSKRRSFIAFATVSGLDFEVIGNQAENPELLEAKNENL